MFFVERKPNEKEYPHERKARPKRRLPKPITDTEIPQKKSAFTIKQSAFVKAVLPAKKPSVVGNSDRDCPFSKMNGNANRNLSENEE